GGTDTASYAAATSAVTVDLNITTAQDTQGAGRDKLLNIDNLIGSLFSDTLYGDGNANVLDGGGNIDIMDGRGGSDTYYVTAGDLVTDTGTTGTDVVYAGVDYALGSGIENLVLTGTTAINGRGNVLNNTLIGNSSGNILNGVDSATPGTGTDTLRGLAGNDTYFVNSTTDVVDETFSGSAGVDLVISSVNFTLATNVENLRLVGSATSGTGNTLVNTLIGNSGNNTLNGGDGNDILTDLLGGDDTLIGGAGADSLKAGAGNDVLIGGTSATASDSSADSLAGGTGNDTYNVTDTTDVVNEALSTLNLSDLVNSTVTYALNDLTSVGVDNLTLVGSGNINGTGNSL
ncbi:MAG: hypothetical protein FD130_2331, partial [Halothiobacillaceae bacterium]